MRLKRNSLNRFLSNLIALNSFFRTIYLGASCISSRLHQPHVKTRPFCCGDVTYVANRCSKCWSCPIRRFPVTTCVFEVKPIISPRRRICSADTLPRLRRYYSIHCARKSFVNTASSACACCQFCLGLGRRRTFRLSRKLTFRRISFSLSDFFGISRIDSRVNFCFTSDYVVVKCGGVPFLFKPTLENWETRLAENLWCVSFRPSIIRLHHETKDPLFVAD